MIKNISFEPGFIVIETDQGGKGKKYSARDFLQAADIPDLTINSLTLLTALANLVEVLVKTLIQDGVISDELVLGYDIAYLLETLKDELTTDIGDN